MIGNWELQLASLKISWDWLNLAKDGTSEFFFTPQKNGFRRGESGFDPLDIGIDSRNYGISTGKTWDLTDFK